MDIGYCSFPYAYNCNHRGAVSPDNTCSQGLCGVNASGSLGTPVNCHARGVLIPRVAPGFLPGLAISALVLLGCPETPPVSTDGGQPTNCGAGTVQCGSACVNTALDDTNCGACGKTFLSTEGCGGGRCLPKNLPRRAPSTRCARARRSVSRRAASG